MQQVAWDSIIAPSVETIEHMTLRPLITAFVIGMAIIALSGCLYRMEIRQGNHIEASTLQQLEIGMSKNQVQFLLGTPAIVDLYQPDSWYYVFSIQHGSEGAVEQRSMTLGFSNDQLTTIDGDFSPG
ncbi:MAG: outer membrane protein assembly factor BamE [Gammaproteobacteria bacterium]|nr:MAG: outer membrane protein assembly factor BamE [Gammaproteobacteria bacterium]